MQWVNLLFAGLLALLPSPIKIPIYRRLYGFTIGKGVRLGVSPFIGVRACSIGDGVSIGHGNLFYAIQELRIEHQARIGFLNIFRGGQSIILGSYCTILRQNTVNSILDRDFVDDVAARFVMGTGAVLASGHWVDFSATVKIGDHVIVGGRNSSFWTHNRQRGRSIVVGHHTYLGSEVRVAPGTEIAPLCVVALGSVLSGRYESPRVLIGGNPAKVVRDLREPDLFLVVRRTRDDIPLEVSSALLPDELHAIARKANEDRPSFSQEANAIDSSEGEAGCAALPESLI